jgi:hypothetical protein
MLACPAGVFPVAYRVERKQRNTPEAVGGPRRVGDHSDAGGKIDEKSIREFVKVVKIAQVDLFVKIARGGLVREDREDCAGWTCLRYVSADSRV